MPLTKSLSKCPSSTNPSPLPWKISGCAAALRHYSLFKTLHVSQCSKYVCLDNCSYSDLMLRTSLDTFRVVAYSAVFFQVYPHVINHIQHYWGILMCTETLLRHIKAYSAPCVTIFKTSTYSWVLVYLKPEAYLKPCESWLDIIRTLPQEVYIQAYSESSATLEYAETWHTRNTGIFRTLP